MLYESRQKIVRYFNPLPPYGGRLGKMILHVLPQLISIHSLRMEGDLASTI